MVCTEYIKNHDYIISLATSYFNSNTVCLNVCTNYFFPPLLAVKTENIQQENHVHIVQNLYSNRI